MRTYRPVECAAAALERWYFAANLSEAGKPWHAEPYPGPYRVFAVVASDARGGGECLGVAYFAGPSDLVVIAGRPVPAAVLAAATRLPLGLGCYLGPSGELCNGLGRPAVAPVGSGACPHCNGNRCVPDEAADSAGGRWTFCKRCGGHGWVEHAEPVAAPAPTT